MSDLVRVKLLKHPKGFTGRFGNYDFVDNVSQPMLRREAERLSVVTSVEFIDSENIIEKRKRERGQVTQKVEEYKAKQEQTSKHIVEKPALKYDRSALESIADKEGSEGLRKIASEYNVKARSIRELISAILKAQE
jgi:hypothetical protein